MFDDHLVRPVDHYGPSLLGALRRVSPAGADPEPTVVVLTPGVYNSAYFEHAFLARQMGVELVEGRDLVVDDHVVSMRTTHGLKRVDVIYRRIDDAFLDPVVFRSDSILGVPGLMSAARAGNVTIANAVGNGVADDKAVYAYVPELIRYYLGDRADPRQRAHLPAVGRGPAGPRARPARRAGGEAGGRVGRLRDADRPVGHRRRVRGHAQADRGRPRGYIAQEVVPLSRHPTLVDDHLEGRHVDLRPFVLCGDTVEVIPGGLTRVALRKGSLVVNSSQGGGSKDTWVLADRRGGPAMMLARHAESLFWAGRQIERAEDTARMLDVTYHGLLEAMPWEAERSWKDLLKVLWLDRPFAELEQGVRAATVSEFLVFDPDNPGAIVSAVSSARENARGGPRADLQRAVGGDQHASTSSCARGTCAPTSRPARTSSTSS